MRRSGGYLEYIGGYHDSFGRIPRVHQFLVNECALRGEYLNIMKRNVWRNSFIQFLLILIAIYFHSLCKIYKVKISTVINGTKIIH